jgi:hypothetical protein
MHLELKMSEPKKTETSDGDASNKNEKVSKIGKSSAAYDTFILESVFKDPVALLKLASTTTVDIAKDAVFALDTNALLAPFGVGRTGQEEITTLYKGLNEHNRLFAPERAIREFLRHRSRAIAELLVSLKKEVSSLEKAVTPPACAMLEYSKEYSDLLAAGTKLKDARKAYLQSLQSLTQTLKDWRWGDPISVLYSQIFEENSVAKCRTKSEEIAIDLAHRVLHRIPPGYKDAGKEDGGVGDVLIWHSLLHLAQDTKTAVVFVTGEEKADWMTRSGGDAPYPRFELVAEFFEKTGQQLVIVDYARFLELHELSPETVDQARHSYAEGLGRFDRLRQRILSILDSLRGIANDYQYSSESSDPCPIRDNRMFGLTRGFNECLTAYNSIYPNGSGLSYLEGFSELLAEMSSLNASIEYQAVRMKYGTEEEEAKLRKLCRDFVDQHHDFLAFVKTCQEW